MMVEVVGIEPTSKSTSKKESYVCSRIRANDGCESFVKETKPGEFNKCPDSLLSFILRTFLTRSLPTFCYWCRPRSERYNPKTMQPLQIRVRFRIQTGGFLLGLPTNLDTHSILQYPCRNQCTPR